MAGIEWADVFKVVVPGIVAAAGAVGATFFLEPWRLAHARRNKLAELRFEAHRKMVAALTRLDVDRENLEDHIQMGSSGGRELAGAKFHESYRLAVLQFAESRFLLDDAQLKAVRELFRGYESVFWSPYPEIEYPVAASVIRDHFDAGLSMDLPRLAPARVREVKALVEPAPAPVSASAPSESIAEKPQSLEQQDAARRASPEPPQPQRG